MVDTSFFPSIGAVNPALTAMANAMRVGDHLLERLGASRTAAATSESAHQMAGATREFFDGLCAGAATNRRSPAPARSSGSRSPTGRRAAAWTLVVADGRIRESDDAADADCVIRADAATFDGLVTGRANATAAMLRGVLQARWRAGGHGR